MFCCCLLWACVAMESALRRLPFQSILQISSETQEATPRDSKETSIQHQTISLVFCGFVYLRWTSINNQVPHDYVVISFSALSHLLFDFISFIHSIEKSKSNHSLSHDENFPLKKHLITLQICHQEWQAPAPNSLLLLRRRHRRRPSTMSATPRRMNTIAFPPHQGGE